MNIEMVLKTLEQLEVLMNPRYSEMTPEMHGRASALAFIALTQARAIQRQEQKAWPSL